MQSLAWVAGIPPVDQHAGAMLVVVTFLIWSDGGKQIESIIKI